MDFPLPVMIAAPIVAVIVAYVVFKILWRVAEPNEALVIAGARSSPSDTGLRIVVGHGALVMPWQKCRVLDLSSRQAALKVNCITAQGLHIEIDGIAMYKVADDLASIANAARRFLDMKPEQMDSMITVMLDGHTRSIAGALKLEDLISERDKVTGETREAAGIDAQKLGLTIDTLQIQDISGSQEDNFAADKYITALSTPHMAAVAQQARIATATSNQAATKAEQDAAANNAEATRDSQLKQAQYQAEVDSAKQKAAQAGPLADALAKQDVVRAATETASLIAAQTEQSLQATVRKPADAQAYATATQAAGQRDAAIAQATGEAQQIRLRADAQAYAAQVNGAADGQASQQRGEGEAAAIKAKLLAEADGIKARAEALGTNQEAVIAQTIATNMPEIVGKATGMYDKVEHMVVTPDGLTSGITALIGLGLSLLPQITKGLQPSTNGHAKPGAPVVTQ